MKWADTFKIFCIHCKHQWILRSDQKVSTEDYVKWFKQLVRPEHNQVCKKGKKWWEFWK